MIISRRRFIASIQGVGFQWMPFADAAGGDLTLRRLWRLALFQVPVGMAVVLLNGTLNRVMVVELGQPAWAVSLMVAIPLLLAPMRALIGFRSDHHKSFLGWRRVPYLWFGTLMQFGGLAIMPFALIVMTEPHNGPEFVGPLAAMLAFLLVGGGMHTTQTAGLALATDLATEETRPRVVAALYVMSLVGMIIASLGFAVMLRDFDYVRLIKVLQGAAMLSAALNLIALWKQEPRRPELTRHDRVTPAFMTVWRSFAEQPKAKRLLVALGLGTLGFAMQDILLEPYGATILGLSVSQTTGLTALLSGGMLVAFLFSARALSRGIDPIRLAAYGTLLGVFAFAAVILAAPLQSSLVFCAGTAFIGLGAGLFSVGTLTSAMLAAKGEFTGLALGAWGTVQIAATGIAVFAGGGLRDLFSLVFERGDFGIALSEAVAAYGAVYHIEILILFATLIALGPLVRKPGEQVQTQSGLQLAEFPT